MFNKVRPRRYARVGIYACLALKQLPEKKHLRIRIRNKTAELDAAIKYIKPDVICGTESKLNEQISNSEVFPSNYTVYRKDRATLGGGVFILVLQSLVSVRVPDMNAHCEAIWIKIKMTNTKDLLVGCFYTPHRNMKDMTELGKLLKPLSNTRARRNAILIGDFIVPTSPGTQPQ